MKQPGLFFVVLIAMISFVLLTGCASLSSSPTSVTVVSFASYPAQVLGVVIDLDGKVLDVEQASAAQQAGIFRGDVLQKINNLSVTSQRKQVRTALSETKKGQDVIIVLQRNGNEVVLAVKPSLPAPQSGLATATPLASPDDYL